MANIWRKKEQFFRVTTSRHFENRRREDPVDDITIAALKHVTVWKI